MPEKGERKNGLYWPTTAPPWNRFTNKNTRTSFSCDTCSRYKVSILAETASCPWVTLIPVINRSKSLSLFYGANIKPPWRIVQKIVVPCPHLNDPESEQDFITRSSRGIYFKGHIFGRIIFSLHYGLWRAAKISAKMIYLLVQLRPEFPDLIYVVEMALLSCKRCNNISSQFIEGKTHTRSHKPHSRDMIRRT